MNPWKLATIGIALIGVTALSTGLTTAYFMRPGVEPAPAGFAAVSQASATPVVQHASASPAYAVAPRPAARVVRTASTTVAAGIPVADCATTGDRVWRIAKPGALGGLIGAGVGAAGGAIADGGKAAGKGALIGGLAGAVLGAGYGAYKTKAECGSVLGGRFATAPTPVYGVR